LCYFFAPQTCEEDDDAVTVYVSPTLEPEVEMIQTESDLTNKPVAKKELIELPKRKKGRQSKIDQQVCLFVCLFH